MGDERQLKDRKLTSSQQFGQAPGTPQAEFDFVFMIRNLTRILIGFAGGSGFPTIEPFKILTHGISVTGALHSLRTAEERDEAITILNRLFSEGKISMPIDRIISFAEVPQDLERLGGAVNGKLIARVGGQCA